MANWDILSRSGNVEDRRGIGGGLALGGAGGLITLLIVIGMNFLGINVSPSTIESVLNATGQMSGQASEQPAEFKGDDSYEVFASQVLGSTETLWTDIFRQNNQSYTAPKLVLFREATQSGCGYASSQVGPHFCPADNTIYLDERFFDDVIAKFGGDTGKTAQAYVIAHEVAHSVQHQTGTFDSSNGQLSPSESVAVELQADCYAGVWAYSVARQGVIGEADIPEALSAAAAVGDDRVQQSTTGQVSPETWTHGSSEQRVNAFTTGYKTGEPAKCSLESFAT